MLILLLLLLFVYHCLQETHLVVVFLIVSSTLAYPFFMATGSILSHHAFFKFIKEYLSKEILI